MAEMVTPLELVRALLWEVDEAEALMVRQLRGEGQSRSFRKRLVARHRIRQLLDETTAKKVRLLRILKEEEPSQQERERERGDGEMGRRGGVECDASSFYDCVKQLRCGATVATTSWSKPELAST
ncbi:MAG: hypothetical protein Q8P67_19685, partial [archaeon]|nr:hypothetical protein [archaeon]